ncbi:MAG: ATP-binding protein [Ramlibacter sp.]
MSADTSSSRIRPLRLRLLMLAASGLVPLVIVLAWGLDHLVQERRLQAERSVLELSRALATAVDAELRSIATLLDHMGTSDELERADLRSFHQSARRAAVQLGWREVVLSDGEGRVLLRTTDQFGSTSPVILEPKSLAQVIATKAPAVSHVLETPALSSDAFYLRVPVMRGGKLVYVLAAVLPVDRVSAVLTRQNIPSGSVAAVFDQVSHRVVRSRTVTSPFPTPSMQALLDRGDAQGVGRTVTREGTDSYTGYTRLRGFGWVMAVGTSVEEANKGLYALLQAVALGLAASLALAVLLAWLLARRVMGPIDQLKDGAAALGRGDPVNLPALDIVELNDVALVLASAAQERDRAAARVNDALHVAEDANRSKDQFLAMLGHELRNPLAPISTAVQLMALKGDEKTAQERHIIERQLVHVTRLVDDLLDVSRITGGRLEIRREPIHVAQLLEQVVDTLQQSLYRRSLTLDLAPGMQDVWVTGDEVRLVQVFNNLLVNAIKFTAPGQSISVSAAPAGSDVQVEVRDDGVGLSPEELDKIFELFYQAPQSSDRALGGLGLGLPIVRSLLKMHDGTVRATSDGPGHGCRFTVRLPVCEPPAGTPEALPAPAAQGVANILVVDDNEDAADTCATLLELSGYSVRVAYTPQAALEALREFTPAGAILDIGLPGMSGYVLAGAMRAQPHEYHGYLVALTGYGQAADIAESRQAGFDAHLTKPVSPAVLMDLVKKLTQSPAEQGAG